MRRDESLTLVFLLVIAGGVIALALYLRYKQRELEHKERLSAIDKGAPLPALEPSVKPWTPRAYLLQGLIWLFAGVGMAAFIGGVAATTNRQERVEYRVDRAIRLKERGATEDQIREAMNERTRDGMPVALALIGLIPAGVGIAYLITYRVETKRDLSAG